MTEPCTPISTLQVQVNIVPFGTIQIIDTNYNDCSTIANRDGEELAFEFPTGSVISGSIIYEPLTISSKSP